jgi:hypothetical protein
MEDIQNTFNDILEYMSTEKRKDSFLTYLKSFLDDVKKEDDKKFFFDIIRNKFFNENTFYYCKTSQIYFNCFHNQIIPCNEDNAIYYVLDFLTNNKIDNDKSLDTNVKQVLKNKIIKCIKENYPIRDIIPESETIQEITGSLVPGIFSCKSYAKLFCVMIGDIILKKQTEQKVILYTKSHIKPLLNNINKNISIYITNINIFNYIKFKYIQDHDEYDRYFLPCNDINVQYITFNSQFFVDLICICIYNSSRYNNINEYVEQIEDKTKKENIQFFKYNNKSTIINKFIDTYLIMDNSQSIHEKDLLFLWKKFNVEGNLAINLFTNNQEFIEELFEHVNEVYDSSKNTNIMNNYYSFDIPYVSLFIDFWNENFAFDEDEYYFELNEVLFLFNKYDKHKKHNVNEMIIQEIIQNYFSHYQIVGNKNIHNLKCKLWDKREEIDNFITKQKIDIQTHNISFLYTAYCKSKTKFDSLKIGKKYFTQYIDILKNKKN